MNAHRRREVSHTQLPTLEHAVHCIAQAFNSVATSTVEHHSVQFTSRHPLLREFKSWLTALARPRAIRTVLASPDRGEMRRRGATRTSELTRCAATGTRPLRAT